MEKVTNVMKSPFKENQSKPPFRPLNSCNDYLELDYFDMNAYFIETIRYNKFQVENSLSEKALFSMNDAKFTSVAVDHSISQLFSEYSKQGLSSHVLFIGLDDGRILKILPTSLNKNSPELKSIILAEYQLFNFKLPINNILISFNSDAPNKVIALTSQEIRSFSVDLSCETYKTCELCIGAQDPYCSWSIQTKKCSYTFTNDAEA